MRGKTFDQKSWADLERALRQRKGPEPGPGLRDRVLDDVRRALSEPALSVPRRWTGAPWWAAVAAVLIVGLALSRMAASVTPFFNRPVPAAPVASVRAAADLMRQVSPGLSADEAERLALASASRGQLLPAPIANPDTRLAARAEVLNFQGDVR
jgi:hypothetical protein